MLDRSPRILAPGRRRRGAAPGRNTTGIQRARGRARSAAGHRHRTAWSWTCSVRWLRRRSMFVFGMAATLFMAGMELDFGASRAARCRWPIAAGSFRSCSDSPSSACCTSCPIVKAPAMVALTLVNHEPRYLVAGVPRHRSVSIRASAACSWPRAPSASSSHRRYVAAAFAALQHVAGSGFPGRLFRDRRSSRRPSAWACARRACWHSWTRTMDSSSQLPVRMSLLLVGRAIRPRRRFRLREYLRCLRGRDDRRAGYARRGGQPMRAKIDAVSFGWFFPVLLRRHRHQVRPRCLDPGLTTWSSCRHSCSLFLRGARSTRGPLPQRSDFGRSALPFVLACAVPSLSLIVVITEIGVHSRTMNSDIAAALVGAALLSVMLFPTIAGVLLELAETARRPG